MRFVLSCLLLFGAVLPARAQGDDERPDEGDLNARVFLTLDPGHHVGPIRALLFTPDGKRLVSAGEDRTVQVWDAQTGERLRVFRPPLSGDRGGAILAAALAPDGKTLACGAIGVTFDGGKHTGQRVYLLNLDDGRRLPLEKVSVYGLAVVFSPDGSRLAAVHDRNVHVLGGLTGVWGRGDGRLGEEKLLKTGGGTLHLAFSPDGSRLAAISANDRTIRVWDLNAPDRSPDPVMTCSAETGPPQSLAWSPDGKRLLSGHLAPSAEPAVPALRVWSADGKALRSFTPADLERAWGVPAGTSFWIDQIFFLPGGREMLLLSRNGSGSRLAGSFDPESGRGRLLLQDPGYTSTLPNAGALSPDGRLAAVAVSPGGRRIALLDVAGGANPRYLAGEGVIGTQVGWAPDGHAITWKASGRAAADGLDLRRLERLAAPPPQPVGTVTRRDGWTLERSGTPGDPNLHLSHNGRAVTVAVSGHASAFTLPAAGDVTWVAWVGQQGMHLNDAASGERVRYFRPRGLTMPSVASSPDGKYLLAYSTRGLYYVYRPDREEPLLTVFVSGPDWVAWTPEGYYAATPGGEKLVGWTVNNGPDRLATFYPAERFRKALYRPDVIRLVLEKGGVREALEAANAARKAEGEAVAEGVADLETLLPPRATLQVVEAALPKVKVKATAEAAARGQPVQSLRLLVDGRPLPGGQGVLDLKPAQDRAEAVWEAELPPGRHELKALARSPDTAGASAAVLIDVPAPSAADRPTLHVIAVGIDAYPQKALRLTCAVADARGLAEAFSGHCAGKDNLFGGVRDTTLLDGRATRAAVLDALKRARQAVKPGDLLVFSFAGHGARQGKGFYLLTAAADPANLAGTALSGEDLRAALKDLPCQVLLLLDACHSAAGVRAFIDEAARGLTDDETGVAVLCAAMGAEEAQEKDGHGLFTRAVLEALGDGEGVLYDRHDHRQYVHHLGTFVQDEVKEWSKGEQHPFLTMPYVTESFPIRLLPKKEAGGQ
jgi:WD40 repeat protein